MKWLLTLNATCADQVAQDITKLLFIEPEMKLFDNFPIMEIDVSFDQVKLIDSIPCVHTYEPPIAYKSNDQQTPSSWVLDVLDGTELDNSYSFTRTGKGVHVYVIDSGIELNHREFNGRADLTPIVQEELDDCTQHGTHVAGLIGGKNVGVAKEVYIHSVKVITCASDSDQTAIVSAINFIMNDVRKKNLKSAVINLSLGPHAVDGVFPSSPALESALESAYSANIITVAASGNDNLDACTGVPSKVETVVTVGAIDSNKNRAEFSNFGNCLDLFAPGTNSVSAKAGTTDQYLVKQGTSQAAPIVAGILALIIQENPDLKANELVKLLKETGLRNAVGNNQSPNSVLAQGYSPADDKANINFDSINYGDLEKNLLLPIWAIVVLCLIIVILLGMIVWKLIPLYKLHNMEKKKIIIPPTVHRPKQQRPQSEVIVREEHVFRPPSEEVNIKKKSLQRHTMTDLPRSMASLRRSRPTSIAKPRNRPLSQKPAISEPPTQNATLMPHQSSTSKRFSLTPTHSPPIGPITPDVHVEQAEQQVKLQEPHLKNQDASKLTPGYELLESITPVSPLMDVDELFGPQ